MLQKTLVDLESKEESGIGNRTKLESLLEWGNGNRAPTEAEVESGIEATWKPKRNRGSGSQLVLGIGVPFLTWFRNRLSDPGPVLRNSALEAKKQRCYFFANFES